MCYTTCTCTVLTLVIYNPWGCFFCNEYRCIVFLTGQILQSTCTIVYMCVLYTVVVHGIIHVCMLIYSISDVVFLMQVPMEVMEKKMNWPMWLVYQLRNVIKFMNDLNGRVSDVEELCNETLEVSAYMYILYSVAAILWTPLGTI